ncbi:hypothetical protein [uncultured Roseobacter sp.]|nr:hypothetical protein [uncultured Roseobacter sp.]
MARLTHVTVRKLGPDFGTGIAILIIFGFVVAAFFGHTPSFVQ